MNGEPPKPRWWTRLLRRPFWLTALAVCLLLSALLGPFGWRYYRTRQLVAGIEAHGGRVGCIRGGPQWLRDMVGHEWMKPFDVPYEVSWSTSLFSWGSPIVGASAIVNVGPPKKKLTDNVFSSYVAPLDDLYGLTTVIIIDSDLTERSFERLAQFEQLEVLSLRDKAFDDEALSHFATSFRLKTLALSGTSISDEGLRHLYGLEDLEELSLYDTHVTQLAEWRLRNHLFSPMRLGN